MENGLSASDVALLDGGGMGGNSFMWIFGLLILMGMMNGGILGGGAYDRAATQSDVQYTSQFGQLLDGNRDIMSQANNNANNIVGAINSSEYETIAALKDGQLQLQDRLGAITAGIGALNSTQRECCGETKLLIQEIGNRNDAVTVAQTQKILDYMAARDNIELREKVSRLEMEKQLANVVRFPNTYTYAGGFFPPFMPPLPSTNTGGTTTTG